MLCILVLPLVLGQFKKTTVWKREISSVCRGVSVSPKKYTRNPYLFFLLVQPPHRDPLTIATNKFWHALTVGIFQKFVGNLTEFCYKPFLSTVRNCRTIDSLRLSWRDLPRNNLKSFNLQPKTVSGLVISFFFVVLTY